MKCLPSIAAAIMVISLAMTSRAIGGFVSGNDLYAWCTSSIASAYYLQCIGYVQGIEDAAEGEGFIQGAQGAKGFRETGFGFRWCLRDGITAGQAVEVVTQFLRNHPAIRDSTAAELVANAMQEAWPCPRRD
jgi:hypothetical protein